jgi:hypothetical protein
MGRPKKGQPRAFRLWLSSENCALLYAAAARRNCEPELLVNSVLTHVVGEKLIDAVMDDMDADGVPTTTAAVLSS